VAVENDANLGALGELRDEPQADRTLAYIKLGTGIGAGLVTDGRLFRGEGGTAGEIGHVQVDPAGVLCRCGSRGCLETVVSVPRLIAALAPVTSEGLTPDGLGALVASGHPGAVRVVTDAGRTVGRVVASLVTVLNPGLVVLGGSVSPVNDLLADCIRAAVDEWATPAAASRVTVRASRRGDRGEVEGALALASDLARQAHQASLVG
jgi:predicted NBD/HSP70 family sugar kinase